tara:strand:+ start:89 stop:763 length:675 start_codon:yes stop_codon:yes gene_type:complete
MSKRKPAGFYSEMSEKELEVYTKERHESISKGELACSEKQLYDTLRIRGLLNAFVEEGIIVEVVKREKPNRPTRYWQNEQNRLAEVKKIMDDHNLLKLPSRAKLIEWGHSCLVHAINSYEGGFHNFRQRLGEKNLPFEKGYWKDEENNFFQAQNFMRKHKFNQFPSAPRLKGLGYSSLANSIQRCHGGFPAFREKLRTYMGKNSELDQLESLLESYVNGGNQDD